MKDYREQIMNTYCINEQMLGDAATAEQAKRMVELLTKRGYDVEYGDPMQRLLPVDWDHDAAIDFEIAVLEEMQKI